MQGEQIVECTLSKITRDTIENIYQAPIKVLGKFVEKQFKKAERHLRRHLRR